MSKFIKYPNGYIGVVSDAVADVLCQRPGHIIVRKQPEKQADGKMVEAGVSDDDKKANV